MNFVRVWAVPVAIGIDFVVLVSRTAAPYFLYTDSRIFMAMHCEDRVEYFVQHYRVLGNGKGDFNRSGALDRIFQARM